MTTIIIIYNNKVAIISLQGEPLAILIENQDIAESQRAIFGIAWAFASFKEAAFPMPKSPLNIAQQSADSARESAQPAFGTSQPGGMTIRKVGSIKNKEDKQSALENQVSLF